MFNIEYIKYTWKHKKAFLDIEKSILGYNTIRGYLHDADKLVMYLFIPKKIVSKLHRKYSRHHINKARTRNDFIEMLIDWECARYTKNDKPLNAYETLYNFYPQLEDKMIPLMVEFHLVHLHPACYEENDNPYPLCVGNRSSKCEDCCLNEDYEKFHDPYEQYHK